MKKNITRNEALLTAIGTMVGIGIYFKADNIMAAVGGNLTLAIAVWIGVCVSFIFSGLAASGLAQHADPEGGVIGYFEQFFGKRIGFLVGWFQAFVYTPIILAVLASVIALYIGQVFGIEFNSLQMSFAGVGILAFILFWNFVSVKIATLISVSATYLKVIPLIIVSIYALFFSNFSALDISLESLETIKPLSVLAPIVPIAFMFDGWLGVASLSVDMKNPKKDLAYTFIMSLTLVCAIYLIYFISINLLYSPKELLAAGDDYLYNIAGNILGQYGAKVIITFVIISGIGTLNAFVMSGSRYIEKLADDNLMFCSNFFKKRSKQNTLINAGLLLLLTASIATLLLYLQSNNFTLFGVEIFKGILLEDTVVAISSALTGVVLTVNLLLYKQGKVNFFKGVFCTIVAVMFHFLILFAYVVTSESIMNSIGSLVIVTIIVLLGILINYDEFKRIK